jgi:hypothetical protein
VIGDNSTTVGLDYTASYLDIEPTAQQLADAPAPVSVSSQYLYLPKSLPPMIVATANQVGGTGTTPYEKAVRLQSWFQTGGHFHYSVTAPSTKNDSGSSSAIVDFLQQKKGYCVHFASAMAVMARALYIPARVAVGFLPGKQQADGWRVISSHDAHAWPELYFEGVGWVRFEPTPRDDGVAATQPSWSVPTKSVPAVPSGSAVPEPTTSASSSAAAKTPKKEITDPKVALAKKQSGAGVPWRLVGILLVVVLALSAPLLTSRLSSRRRWSRAGSAGTTSALAEAAWADLRLKLSDLGVRWDPAWTPRVLEQQLVDEYEFTGEVLTALDRLAMEIETARYAPPNDDLGRTAAERSQDVATVVSDVSAMKSGRTKWQARLWPPSGVSILAELGPWMDSTADRAGQQASALGTQVKEKVGSGRR